MQFRQADKALIRAGQLTVSFRRWKSPRAQVGRQYNLHPEGAIEVTAITPCKPRTSELTALRAAGYASRAELAKRLGCGMSETVYQVDFRYLGPDLVRQPQRGKLAGTALVTLAARLERMDRRAAAGPWTQAVLELISQHPGTRAGDLAGAIGWETQRFKEHVRRLKKLGLTVSSKVGYELSPRGQQVLDLLYQKTY